MMTQTIKTKIKNRHGLNVSVLVEIPENPKGLVFIIHGFTGAKDQPHILATAKAVLNSQYISVSFDTTHSFGESDGSAEHCRVDTHRDDLADVIKWAKTQDWYLEPFVIAGFSLGGIALLEYIKDNKAGVKAIAPMASVVSGELIAQKEQAQNPEGFRNWQETGFKKRISTTRPKSANIPWDYMQNMMRYNSLDYAASITIPVFMLVGSADKSTPPEAQQLLFDRLGSYEKEIHIIDGAAHDLKTEAELATLKSLFSAWLRKIV